MTRSLAVALTLLGALAGSVHAQVISSFGGVRSAYEYAYGWPGVAAASLNVAPQGGNSATGTATITLVTGTVSTGNQSTSFNPLATTTPIYIGFGGNQELVTPTAVSGCGAGQPQNSCQVTASFTKLHGPNEPVFSGTFGLQEAINAANTAGGGAVAVNASWAGLGGTDTTIGSATAYSNVYIQDNRVGYTTGKAFTGAPKYWSMQPTTLTSIATPTTLTSSTVFSASTGTGTWTNAAVYACVTYVDALGGEGPCSATYNFTATASVPVTFVSPAASTGAVGWRAYAGASYNGAYLLPITSTACTLTTLESVVPACAIGSNATFTAIYATTAMLRPNAQSPTVNLYLPMPQAHTTFAYKQTGSVPTAFQTSYGPFPAFGSTTSGQVDVIGSVNLPTGYLNEIGRAVRLTGKITATVNTAAVPTLTISAGWVGGTTTGAPVAVCTLVGAAYGSSAAFNGDFSCTITANSSTTAMTNGALRYAPAAGGTAGVYFPDTGTAAISSLSFSPQNTLYVIYTSGTNTTTAVQLLSLNVETLQ